jgi:hypothetical protein
MKTGFYQRPVGLMTLALGPDDLVMLVHPQYALAGRRK